jgi:DnaJ family protein C protein 13
VHLIAKNCFQLFSQKVLPYAAELSYYTVSVSPLNAEEVRREGGIEIISASLQRCVEVLTVNVTIDSMPAQVCMHTLKAFSVFGNFAACREVILQNRSICHNAVRCLNFTHIFCMA